MLGTCWWAVHQGHPWDGWTHHVHSFPASPTLGLDRALGSRRTQAFLHPCLETPRACLHVAPWSLGQDPTTMYHGSRLHSQELCSMPGWRNLPERLTLWVGLPNQWP